MSLVAYLSGHGFGHYTRSSVVLERVAARIPVHLRTSDRALVLAGRARFAASLAEVDVGPGVAQRGPLEVDLPGTRRALQAHLDRFDATVEAEAVFLRGIGARLVYGDVPPLAFAAAARAGIPSVGMSNFSWSWIYEGYAAHDPWFDGAARRLAAAESLATRFLALAMGGGLAVFPRRVDIAPIVRRPNRTRAEARARLGLDESDPRPVVLLSFGGFGAELDLAGAAASDGFRFLVVSAGASPSETAREWVRAVEPDGDLTHPDLVAAADCVLGKAGYSTVAECLGARTPFVHVPRGEFREQAPLLEGLERWLPSARLSDEDFRAGRWGPAIRRALAAHPPEPAPAGDGIAEAERAILDLLGPSGEPVDSATATLASPPAPLL